MTEAERPHPGEAEMIRRPGFAPLGPMLGLLVWQRDIPPDAAVPLGVLLAGGALAAAFCALRLLRAGSMARVIVLGCAPALLLASGALPG